MPRISAFYGIVVTMYSSDHAPPHFHARYGEYEAQIVIVTDAPLAGQLPIRALRLIREWAELHQAELQANWERAQARTPLARIDPPAMNDTHLLARVTAVEPLEGFRLRLSFTDGLVREVDLSGDLWGPMAEPLQDPTYFRQVRVDPELGTVVWPNGYDLDPDVLHGDHQPVPRPTAHAAR